MTRTIALILAALVLILAALVLIGGGWWGWQNLRPLEDPPQSPATAEPPGTAQDGGDDAAGASETDDREDTPADAATGEAGEAQTATPAEPALTPPPRDAELPPETGSEMAILTERTAEAAIAAADARAQAEATARAEAAIRGSVLENLTARLEPLLSVERFDTSDIRAMLNDYGTEPDPLAQRIHGQLFASIDAVLTDFDQAAQPAGEVSAADQAVADASENPAPSDPATEGATTDPEPYITRIREVLR